MSKFSADKWVRIWFSTKPDVFLTEINRKRVLEFLQNHPEKEMTFIYDDSLLNAKGKADFEAFKQELHNAGCLSRIKFSDFSSSLPCFLR